MQKTYGCKGGWAVGEVWGGMKETNFGSFNRGTQFWASRI